MFRSLINSMLPDDEYKRIRVLYFMAEAVILTVFIFLCLGTLAYFFEIFTVPAEVLLFLTPFLIAMYIFFRYIFSGLEYTEIFHEKDYQKERKRVFAQSLIAVIIFSIAMLIVKGIPSNINEWLDFLIPIILFIVFYYLISVISLKRSINKNKQLDD